MNPVYSDIVTLLNDNGFTDIFGSAWGAQDKQILVMDSGGVPSELKRLYENPTFQILVRGEKFDSDINVYTVAKSVSDFLIGLVDCIDIGTTGYTGFEPDSNIAALGKDANERFVYTMNFSTYRNAV
jgi:hypothetical protein